MTLTQIKPAGLSTPVDLADNAKIRLGTGNDLEIYHDGSHSYIKDTGTGRLILQSSQLCLQSTTGENFLVGNPDAETELYYDNSKKLETKSNGLNVTGRLFATGSSGYGLIFNDDVKISLGNSNDIQIYHDGTNSFITNATNDLTINSTGDDLILKAADDAVIQVQGSENAVLCNGNGSVELYYDNSKKFETDTNGITVTGRVLASGTSNIGFAGLDNVKLSLGTSDDLQIYHNGTNSYINDTGTGALRIVSSTVLVRNAADNENCLVASQNGSVELYYDNSKKLETNSTGIHIFGNTGHADAAADLYGSSNDLTIVHDGTNSLITNATGVFVVKGDDYRIKSYSTDELMYFSEVNGRVSLYYDNSEKFKTNSAGVEISGHIYQSDDNKLLLGNSQDLQLWHGSDGNSRFYNVANTLYMRIARGGFISSGESEWGVLYTENGSVNLYYDGSKKLETTTLGVNVEGHIRFNNSTWTGEMAEGKIQTHSNNMYFQIPNTTNAEWIFRASDGVNRATINLNGSYSSSDERLKKDITTITSAVDTIKKLTGRSFTWKDTNKESFGLIAQEVETVLPDLVTNQQLVGGETNSDPYKSVNYAALTGHLVEAIKELSTKVAALEAA